MTQYLRPISTVSAGAWTASSTTLHGDTDEGIDNADDAATYAQILNDNDDMELLLAPGTDPVTDTLHVIQWRAKRAGTYFIPCASRVQLYQGATLIATGTGSHGDSYSTATYTLSSAEANAISDYTDLRVRVRFTNNMGAAHMHLTAIEFDIPSVDTKASQKATLASPDSIGQVAQPLARGQSVEAC